MTMATASDETLVTIAIIGGGFCGTMVAVNLARAAGASPIRVLLFEKRERFARGLAYGTLCDDHLLNVPAEMMSALPDQPSDFLDWLCARDPSAHPGTFAPRRVYGDYLEDLLLEAVRGGRVELIREEVVDLAGGPSRGGPVTLRAASGRTFEAGRVVLALGNSSPQDLQDLERPVKQTGYVADPWNGDALEGLEPDESIALIGSGLTAVDLVVDCLGRGHRGKIVAVSRHGLLPCRHAPAPPRPEFDLRQGPRTARRFLKAVRAEAAICQAEGGDWRSVVDGIRPVAQELWRSLGEKERGRFVRHVAPRWDVHRHRVAPDVDEKIRAAIGQGCLEIVAGRVLSIDPQGTGLVLSLQRRGTTEVETIRVARAINCTGPSKDIRTGASGLVRALLEQGIARPGPLALGLDVAESGALIDRDGLGDERLLAIGPMLKAQLWETTAVRELRCQARDLADRILGRPLA
jgi:uncharacterized NAD(P)/FAD-binding protein YdhS